MQLLTKSYSESKDIQEEDRIIAYFSMEIGIDTRIPSYSGGLGVLAADTIKSFADLNTPLVAVTLLYRKGYFCQDLDEEGNQKEMACEWSPESLLKLLPSQVEVTLDNRKVFIQAWEYRVIGANNYWIPILFLDTDMEQNDEYARSLTHYLYGEDDRYRLA
ncbi:MAG: alpha-glucan family phosphorylase, partial [Candidatus Hodarchaeales archaeon]